LKKNKAGKFITLLWFGSLFSAGLSFGIQLVLARGLNPNDYGNFMASFVTITSLVPLVGFGIHSYWLKAFGKEGWYGMIWVSSSLRFLFLTSFFTIILIVVWALYGNHSRETMLTLILLIPFLIGQALMELLGAKFQLEEKYIRLSFIQFFPNLFRLIFLIIIMKAIPDSFSILWIPFLYSTVSLGIIFYGTSELLKMKNGDFELIGHDSSIKSKALNYVVDKKVKFITLISESWPFGLAILFHLIYFQSDIILIKYIKGGSEAGFYSVSVTIISAILLLPTVIYQKFLLPKFHRWSNNNRDLFFKVYKKGNQLMLITGLVVMVLLLLISKWIIINLFSEAYFNSILIIRLMSINIPIMFIASSVGAVLVTQQHMKSKVKIMGIVALLNITLNIIFIPIYGNLGAVFTTVFSNSVLLILFYVYANKKVFK